MRRGLLRFFSSKAAGERHDLDPLLLLKGDKPLLQIEVIGARELFKKGLSLDPYCTVRLGTTMYKTSVVKRTSDPVFGETFVFDFSEDDKLQLQVWDQETFSADVLMGTAETTIEQIRKGQEQAANLPGTHGKGVETFFHLIPPDLAAAPQENSSSSSSLASSSKPVTWVQEVLDKSTKAGREAVDGVAKTWLSFLNKDLQEKIKTSAVQPQGRLYVRFKIAPASSLGTVLPQVVPPAKIDPAVIRSKPKRVNAEWDVGLNPPDRMFRILSLDGGGVRGVLTAGLLRRLVKENRFPKLLEDADLIAGTSTGGILALLFAAGYSPAEAQRLYMYHCPKIFTTSPARRYSPFSARYQNSHLLSMMQAYFGDLKISELPTPVMVTSFKIRSDPADTRPTFYKQTGRGWRPSLFSNVRRNSGQVDPDETLCSDVACRTSAAPTFFPAYQNYVDGAIFANNPALSAVAKASSHYKLVHSSRNRIALLSLGAGDYDYFIPESDDAAMDWGLRQWAPYLRSILLDSNAISIETNLTLLLGDGYHRLNPRLPHDVELDDYTAMNDLLSVSRKCDLTETENWIRNVWYRSFDPLDQI